MTANGNRISIAEEGQLIVPDNPTIPFIEGDGTGPDIWRATRLVLDAAVAKAYNGARAIDWLEVMAGEKAFNETGEWLPEATLEAIRTYRVAIKGPLDDTGGRWHPQRQRSIAPGARSLRLRAPGALYRRHSEPHEGSGKCGHGRFPGKYRRRLHRL